MYIPNKLIPISDGYISTFTTGTGKKTIIFLSGGLTSSPILDFKKLVNLLEANFKIVIIEKFGYGFSSDSNTSRNIDTILEDTRNCLSALNIKPPFILAPHSMSGPEALWWVEKYPNEIDYIIGLDMANFEAYSNLKINFNGLKLSRILVKMKIPKIFPKLIESDAVKYSNLSPSEKKIFSNLFYKNFITKATWNEIITVKENANTIKNVDLSSTNMLIFSSNGKGTGIKRNKWIEIQKAISYSSKNHFFFLLDCSHYVHNHKADEIADTIKKYLL